MSQMERDVKNQKPICWIHIRNTSSLCAVEVYWDVDGCVSRSHHHIDHGDSTAPRYYATYIKGQLCGKKLSFDTWETAYHTLEECCEENFYFDIEECLKSKN